MKDKAIKDEIELEYSIQSIAKMYAIRDRQAAETLHDRETREDLVAIPSPKILAVGE